MDEEKTDSRNGVSPPPEVTDNETGDAPLERISPPRGLLRCLRKL